MKQYSVTGMTCAACSARVEKAVSSVPGVSSCSVSLLTNSMGVEGAADPAQVVAAVEAAGYGAAEKGAAAQPQQKNESLEDKETPRLKKRLLWSLGFLLVLMYFSMGHMMWGWPLPPALSHNHVALGLIQLLLTGMIMVINQRFFISGFKSLWHRSPNMDTLVAMGAAAAFIYSTYALFAMTFAQTGQEAMDWMMELYFESAGMILALITLGKMLEAKSKGRTTDALKSLMSLAPKTASLVREDGSEGRVPVEQVQAGDIFAVRPGESVPVDGVVLEGTSALDESALTGESLPVDKAPGDPVSAATINRSGYLRCRASRVGQDTTLSQIIQMVSDAAATKAPIAKVADKVSGVFVPAVIAVAAVTTLVWLFLGQGVGFALARGISVLVISCPCALGLATPVAIMVGSGLGAKNGILFKTAVSLEAAGRTQIVVLDKTGTITSGRPAVTDIVPVPGMEEEALLCAAASLEEPSEHPLASAIVEEAKRRQLPVTQAAAFQAVHGRGVQGEMGGQVFLGGNQAMMEEAGVDLSGLAPQAQALSAEGKTPMFFAAAGRALGLIAVADPIKEDSPEAIRQLQAMGMRVVMLTGDNVRTAQAIGKQAGVDQVIAGVLPDGKEAVVRGLKEQGKVAMVGDGINDAPALTRADLGIAIGAGTDVAIDAADVVLMKSRLLDVPAAIRLSRAALRNIHQNLFWAFFYNTVGIPLAMGLFIPFGLTLNPMFGAAAMSLSSFCVVSNALRLNWFKLYDGRRDHKGAQRSYHYNSIDQAPGHSIQKDSQEDSIILKEDHTMTKTLKIEGMMCGHCEARVKKALEALPQVESAQVSHETGTAAVTLNDSLEDSALKEAVEAQDYRVLGIE